jgi:hypothetical protein
LRHVSRLLAVETDGPESFALLTGPQEAEATEHTGFTPQQGQPDACGIFKKETSPRCRLVLLGRAEQWHALGGHRHQRRAGHGRRPHA